MELLSNYINQIKVPSQFDNVFSEECVFSYDSPVSWFNFCAASSLENIFKNLF